MSAMFGIEGRFRMVAIGVLAGGGGEGDVQGGGHCGGEGDVQGHRVGRCGGRTGGHCVDHRGGHCIVQGSALRCNILPLRGGETGDERDMANGRCRSRLRSFRGSRVKFLPFRENVPIWLSGSAPSMRIS